MTSEYSIPEQPLTSSLSNNSDDYSNKVGAWLRSCFQLAESSSNQVIRDFQEIK